MADDAARSEALASFIAITDASPDQAAQMLSCCDYDVAAAVELFFATSAPEPAPAPGGGAFAGIGFPPPVGGPPFPAGFDMDGDDDEFGDARRAVGGGGFGGSPAPRAADARAFDTLRGPAAFLEQQVAPPASSLVAGTGAAAAAAAAAAVAAGFGAFRSVDAIAASAAGGASHPAGTGGEGDGGEAAGGGGAGGGATAAHTLERLFSPPHKLLFGGSVEQAKAVAAEKDAWLVVNLQRNSEFASHQLNRDTWGHPAVADLLSASFVFMQLYPNAEEGDKFASFYNLMYAPLPVTLVIDPITGAKMHTLSGFVSPEALMEVLLPLVDAPPSNSAGPFKRARPGRAGAGGGSAEDAELAEAIAASLKESRGGSGGGGGGADGGGAGDDDEYEPYDDDGDGDGDDAGAGGGGGGWADAPAAPAAHAPAPAPPLPPPPPPAPTALSPAAAAAASAAASAAAAARVPPEPPASDPSSCTVALRLPDGSRVTRRWRRDEPCGSLCLWATAAAGGAPLRPFRLASGAPPVPLPAADDAAAGASLEAAGLVNALVSSALCREGADRFACSLLMRNVLRPAFAVTWSDA